MKKFLHPGVNVFQNDNEDYVVHFDQPLVTIKDRTYNSTDAFLSDLYHTVFTTLGTLINEAQELKGDTQKHTKPMPNTAAFYLVPKPKKATKPKTAYNWKPQIPAHESIYTMKASDPNGLTPEEGNTYKPAQPSDSAKMLPELNNRNPVASVYVTPPIEPSVIEPGETLSDFQIAETVFPEDNENFSIEGGIEYKSIPLYSKDISIFPENKTNMYITTESHKESGGSLIVGSAYVSDTEKSVVITNPLDNSIYAVSFYEHREYLQTGPVIIETREVYILQPGDWKKKIIRQTRTGLSVSPVKGLLDKVRIGGFRPSIDFKATTDWQDLPIAQEDQTPPPPTTITNGY